MTEVVAADYGGEGRVAYRDAPTSKNGLVDARFVIKEAVNKDINMVGFIISETAVALH